MISLVAKVINLFALSLRSVVLSASFVGSVIFTAIAAVCAALLNFVDSVIVFIQIVYEDNQSIFSEDIPNFTNDVIDTFVNQLLFIWGGFAAACHGIYCQVSAVVTSINWLINATFLVTSEVACLMKASVIFVGDTLWLVLTFVPVYLPRLVKLILNNVSTVLVNAIVGAYMTLLKFTNFLTDVPLESFVGLISAMIIVRFYIHFRDNIQSWLSLIYWSLLRNALYLYYLFYNYFTDSEVRVITSLVGGRDSGPREADNSMRPADAADAADALCVICQERQKCVLTLPCRHICLCNECCMRLYGYQRTCPICRTFIYHSVTVYL